MIVITILGFFFLFIFILMFLFFFISVFIATDDLDKECYLEELMRISQTTYFDNDKYNYYSVARSYTKTPMRVEDGAKFREEVLVDLLKKSIKERKKLVIDLAGVHGYDPSFLKEAFGGLVEQGYYSKNKLTRCLIIKCNEMPLYAYKSYEFIMNAKKIK